jgi:metal-responsive CopG/Arc/MetJ family transcriptional regulator
MKTAISLPDEIFNEVENFAKEHNYSRSEVFVIAIRRFLEQCKSAQMLKALDDVYVENESGREKTVREKAKRHYATKIIKEPF